MIGMPSAFALGIFSGKFILILQTPADCGLPGSAFSREGVQRKMAFRLFEASAGWDPSGEKGIPENPQIFRNPQ